MKAYQKIFWTVFFCAVLALSSLFWPRQKAQTGTHMDWTLENFNFRLVDLENKMVHVISIQEGNFAIDTLQSNRIRELEEWINEVQKLVFEMRQYIAQRDSL